MQVTLSSRIWQTKVILILHSSFEDSSFFILHLHAARHTERSSDGSKDTDGNLQDSFPSVLVHDFLDLIVSTYLSLEFRVKNVELSA